MVALRWVTGLVLTALAASECPSSTWQENSNGYCYLPLNDPPFVMTTWTSSLIECERIEAGARLAEIYDQHDNDLIVEMTPWHTWLGLRRESLESPFYWLSGHAVTYTNWQTGEPSNSTGKLCVDITDNHKWYTWTCDDGDALAICYTKAK